MHCTYVKQVFFYHLELTLSVVYSKSHKNIRSIVLYNSLKRFMQDSTFRSKGFDRNLEFFFTFSDIVKDFVFTFKFLHEQGFVNTQLIFPLRSNELCAFVLF